MIVARLLEDQNWILVEGNRNEMDQVRMFFTKKINSWFIIKKKSPMAEVDECFMNSVGVIPAGLWVELINVCDKLKYPLTFVDNFNEKIKNNSVSRKSFDDYIDFLFSKSEFKPKDYQRDGVFNMIEYKKCCVEVSTSGGKTFMAYMLFRFMKDFLHIKHVLFVTPKTELTKQSIDKFILYDKKNGLDVDWTSSQIHANAKKKETYDDNIVFGNYQSLCRKKLDFFSKFDAVIVDECHHSMSASIRGILKKCNTSKYKIGMTGTFPMNDSYDSFVIQSYIGPVVFRYTSDELINKEKFATPVHINVFRLKYLDDEMLSALYTMRAVKKSDDPTLGSKIMNKEKELVRDNPIRFKYICSVISKTTKNSLVIFSDVQNEYGRRVYNYLKENTSKTCFYIDGDTSPKIRDKMKEAMEDDTTGNTIIVASMGCFSEGIDIANMWNIFIIETTKSEVTLAQILGRGMRRYEGKEKTNVIDFVDDLRYGNSFYSDNYLFKHGEERINIYTKRGFPCNVFDIDLRNKY